jgi:hypothetical protein
VFSQAFVGSTGSKDFAAAIVDEIAGEGEICCAGTGLRNVKANTTANRISRNDMSLCITNPLAEEKFVSNPFIASGVTDSTFRPSPIV